MPKDTRVSIDISGPFSRNFKMAFIYSKTRRNNGKSQTRNPGLAEETGVNSSIFRLAYWIGPRTSPCPTQVTPLPFFFKAAPASPPYPENPEHVPPD